jgi:hypothetical protein
MSLLPALRIPLRHLLIVSFPSAAPALEASNIPSKSSSTPSIDSAVGHFTVTSYQHFDSWLEWWAGNCDARPPREITPPDWRQSTDRKCKMRPGPSSAPGSSDTPDGSPKPTPIASSLGCALDRFGSPNSRPDSAASCTFLHEWHLLRRSNLFSTVRAPSVPNLEYATNNSLCRTNPTKQYPAQDTTAYKQNKTRPITSLCVKRVEFQSSVVGTKVKVGLCASLPRRSA